VRDGYPAGITGEKRRRSNSGTIFTLGRALQVYWEKGFKNFKMAIFVVRIMSGAMVGYGP
jgi:hypothetical protein